MSENSVRAGALGVVLAFAVAAAIFASGQSIWVDETTQLSGLTLGFGEQLRWLIGAADPDLGVPPDRMPPLSYWLGTLWAALFGVSEASLRGLGITALILAAPAVFLAGQRLAGQGGGLALTAMLFSMPGLIIMAGEIRTYPIFCALACWALWAYVRALLEDRRAPVIWLAAFAILMSYAHYFGVVASCCLFAGLALHRLLTRAPLLPVILAFVTVALSWAGLTPFVLAAAGISGGEEATRIGLATALSETIRFAIRLFADPVFLANRLAFLLLLAGIGALALLTLIRGLTEGRAKLSLTLAMATPVLCAVGGLGVLNILISGFETLRPSYSIWLLPFLMATLVLALGEGGRLRPVAGVAVGVLVLGNLLAGATLFRNLPLYTHGAGEWLAEQVADKAERTLFVHGDGPWGQSYFPTFYLHGDALRQIVVTTEEAPFEFTRMSVEPIADLPAFLAEFEQSYAVQTVSLSGQERAEIVRGQSTCAEMLARKTGAEAPDAAYCGMFGASLTAR